MYLKVYKTITLTKFSLFLVCYCIMFIWMDSYQDGIFKIGISLTESFLFF